MKKNKFMIMAIAVVTIAFSTSCKKGDPEISNEGEVITTLTYTLTSKDTAKTISILSFIDLDGDGGLPPVIKAGNLKANTEYVGILTLSNAKNDVTHEILEESVDHQFFFKNTLNGLDISYSDIDVNKNPIGLATILKTKDAGKGKLTITLRHKPNKEGDNVNNGDITNAGGETDIEVTFDINVE